MPVQPAAFAARAHRAIGAMFFAGFGTGWLCWGVAILRGGGWTLALVIVAGLALGAAAWRRYRANRSALAAEAASPRRRRIARIFNWVNAAQWVTIFVLSNVLNNTGLGAWDAAMTMAVVGLHFLPLAAVMGYRPHYVSGAAMVLLAVVFPFVASAGPGSGVGPLGAGLILWASAIFALAAGSARGDAAAAR